MDLQRRDDRHPVRAVAGGPGDADADAEPPHGGMHPLAVPALARPRVDPGERGGLRLKAMV